MRRSSDGGDTWSPSQVVWDDGGNTCGNPCPVVDQETGTIWLLLTHNPGDEGLREILQSDAEGTRTVWVTSSKDARGKHGLSLLRSQALSRTRTGIGTQPGREWVFNCGKGLIGGG